LYIDELKLSTGLIITALIIYWNPQPVANAAETNQSDPVAGIALSSQEVTNGSLLLLQIETRKLGALVRDIRITFQRSVYPVYPHPVTPADKHFGLIAIPFRTALGPAKLTLRWTNTAGDHSRTIPFTIAAGKYKTDELKVDSSRVNPNKKNIERAQKEARKIKRIYADGSIDRLWKGDFQLPMTSDITSPFGNKRVFNGQLKSYHNGVDFRARTPKPVFASNSGVVKLAESLFYSGNAVVIDHGTGIFTIYAHLSRIDVIAGRYVEKGQRLGLTGATGRVSGPHLHWGVKVKGLAVNPLQLIQLMSSLLSEHG
jgi:murein DD-endopeptidase MepM/ murein hydrolase activator NlpD